MELNLGFLHHRTWLMDWNKWRWPSLSLFQRWITSRCSAFAPYSTGEDASLFLCTFTFSDLNQIKKFCNLGCTENCSRLLSCSYGDFHFYFSLSFLASQDALEVMRVTDWVTYWVTNSALALTLLMWPWWVMIPIEDFTDVILITLMTLMNVI